MTSTMTIRTLPPRQTPAQAARRRARHRKMLLNTLMEALTTIGLGLCFILCAVAMLCLIPM